MRFFLPFFQYSTGYMIRNRFNCMIRTMKREYERLGKRGKDGKPPTLWELRSAYEKKIECSPRGIAAAEDDEENMIFWHPDHVKSEESKMEDDDVISDSDISDFEDDDDTTVTKEKYVVEL